MRIGIIGAGQIGQVLTRRFRGVGHDVAVANSRGPQSLAALAREAGATAVRVEDAVRSRDLTVVTIQLKNVPTLPKGLFGHLPKAFPVIDTCNYYPRTRDGRIAAIEDGMPESVWLEKQIGHPVVKAFNSLYAAKLMDGGRPSGARDRIALPIAGRLRCGGCGHSDDVLAPAAGYARLLYRSECGRRAFGALSS